MKTLGEEDVVQWSSRKGPGSILHRLPVVSPAAPSKARIVVLQTRLLETINKVPTVVVISTGYDFTSSNESYTFDFNTRNK